VADTGIGIPAESLPYIFERFFQIDSSKGGAGIGLSFVKELTAFIGGKLDVSSEVGKGTTFMLSVPKMSVAQEQDTIDRSLVVEDVAPSMAGSSILLVEDHIELRFFVRDLLASHYEVTTASNGAEAWALLEKTSFHLVISDVMMPELDGFGLLSKVRSSPQIRRIPFLLLTALSAAQHRIKGFATGVDDYLTKPFLPKELIVRVNNLLERHEVKTAADTDFEASNLPVHNEDIQPQDWNWLQEVEQMIRKNLPNHQFKMEDAAANMNLSYRQFSRKLNALTGLSPLYYQREIKLQVAREMLEETEYTPQRIADEIGFKKLHHLNTIFAERFGRNFSR
jgi:DNA-binding response OmpR family regulator